MNIKYPRIWIAAHGGPETAAASKDTPPAILRLLAGYPELYIRHLVAFNYAAPPEVLWKLAEEGVHDIDLPLAQNPSSPEELLEQLAGSGGKYKKSDVVAAVARNISSSEKLLGRLSKHKLVKVRVAVAANLAVPIALLEGLSFDDSPQVRLAVIENDACPWDIIERLSDESGMVGAKARRILKKSTTSGPPGDLQPEIHKAFGVWKYPFHAVKLHREPGGYRTWVIDLLEQGDTHMGDFPFELVKTGDKIADDQIADTPYWEVVEVDEDALRITVKPIPPNPFETGVGAGGAPITEHDMAVFSGEFERAQVDRVLDTINAGEVYEYRDVSYILKGTVPVHMGPNGAQGGWYTVTDTWSNRGGRDGMTPEQIMQADAGTLRDLGLPVPAAALDGSLDPRVWNDLINGNEVTDPLALFPGEDLDNPDACLSVLLTHPLPAVKLRNFDAISRNFPEYLEQAIRIAARLPVVGEFDHYWLTREHAIMAAERTLERIDLLDLFADAYDPTNRKFVAWAYGAAFQARDRLLAMFERETAPEALYGILSELRKVGVDIRELMASPEKQQLIQDVPEKFSDNYHREQIRRLLGEQPRPRATSGPTPFYADDLGERIKAVLDDSYDLLPNGTWLAGGCWTAAEALKAWLPPRYGRLVELYDMEKDRKRRAIQHVLVEVHTADGKTGYLDGDGYSTREELLERWRRVERLESPYLNRTFNRKHAVQDCGWDPEAVAQLVERFTDRLGDPKDWGLRPLKGER